MKHPLFRHLGITATLCVLAATCRADDGWGDWPAGQDPAAVGAKVVQNLLDRPKLTKEVSYMETCSGYGAVRFAAAIHNQDLLDQVMARYAGIITTDGTALLPKPTHVDRSVFGILPIEIYKATKDQN